MDADEETGFATGWTSTAVLVGLGLSDRFTFPALCKQAEKMTIQRGNAPTFNRMCKGHHLDFDGKIETSDLGTAPSLNTFHAKKKEELRKRGNVKIIAYYRFFYERSLNLHTTRRLRYYLESRIRNVKMAEKSTRRSSRSEQSTETTFFVSEVGTDKLRPQNAMKKLGKHDVRTKRPKRSSRVKRVRFNAPAVST